MGKSFIKKINKVTEVLNDTIDQVDVISIYWTPQLPPFKNRKRKQPEYTFFSSVHGMFSRIDHTLDHKINLNKV